MPPVTIMVGTGQYYSVLACSGRQPGDTYSSQRRDSDGRDDTGSGERARAVGDGQRCWLSDRVGLVALNNRGGSRACDVCQL